MSPENKTRTNILDFWRDDEPFKVDVLGVS